jgi:hypothetical protein
VKEWGRTMMIFPVMLERRMTRRALVSLCFLRRSMPIQRTAKKEKKTRLNVEEMIKREKKHAPMPISDHVGEPSRSVVNLNTFALAVYVVSSSSSPSPSAP